MKWQLLVILMFPSSLALAQIQCMELFTGNETWERDAHSFSYVDSNKGFKFVATLHEGGMLSIDARLIKEGSRLRSVYHGKKLYAHMVEHFGLERITSIVSMWNSGTNFEQFYSNLRQGMDVESAAKATFSGRMAAFYGFTKIESYFFVPAIQNSGARQSHQPFSVIFVRP